jgi:hypothetical protein
MEGYLSSVGVKIDLDTVLKIEEIDESKYPAGLPVEECKMRWWWL